LSKQWATLPARGKDVSTVFQCGCNKIWLVIDGAGIWYCEVSLLG